MLPGFALSLLAAMWIAVFHHVGLERKAAHNEAVVQSQALARVLSEHVNHILRQTDHATQLFKLQYQETGGALRLPEFTRPGGLLDSVLPARLELPIALYDKSGKRIDSANAAQPSDIGDQPGFQALASGEADAPLFSAPLLDPRNKKWQIQVTRRLSDKAGRFAGLIVIMIDPAFFIDDYDRLNIDDRGALVLMSREAGLSIGRVGEEIFISDTLDFRHTAGSGALNAEVRPARPLDDVDRIYAVSNMPRYALSAVVGIPTDIALATFERHRINYIWITLAASVLIAGFFALLISQGAILGDTVLALRESEARLRTIADALPAMVAYVDANQVYRFHNLAYQREFQREGSGVPGKTVRETFGEKRYSFIEPYILRALQGETLVFEEHDESDGIERTLEVTYIPQAGDDGVSIVGYHVMRQDITSQKREKKRLLKLSQMDTLTGLANRAGFAQKLGAAMRESAEEGQLMAVMYMDIDHFKPVNDTHGHNTGDALLKAFSARLTHTLRVTDTIARLGGDEFTIIMERIARPEDAAVIAAKIVAAMQAPFELDGITVSVSASIGLAYYSGGPLDADALLKQADIQLYQAKQAGRNTYRPAA
jgi:diguanylate cyclase (GGDEF)-like protein/PAS domain S-box-containing protein